ncbi:uncharacterized protein [Littorina saxatilis]|uniref:uncharacterized protein n=1 Tax=Littorina saxatilis TaxID=31220 RepID=UPI0038B6B210
MPNSSDSGTGNRRLAAVIRPCFLCLICFDGITPTTHVTVTHCDIAPGSLKDPAEITCNFPWDLNQTQQSFAVYRYKPNGHEKVLVCFWSSGRFVCNQKDGFKAPEVVSYQFNTTIPNEEDTEFGCDVYPPDFTTEVRRCRCPKRSASEKVEVTESTPETKCKEHTEKNAVEYHIVIILLVLLFLLW